MVRDVGALANSTFDVLVIGGGIVGAGIARDAAMRGLRVALVEKSDFASGTSSRSSKLIHGGFRYLEQYAFGLVAEACRERRILRHIAPHLVKPLPLLMPVYEGDRRPLWLMRIGMTLYDLLAMYGNAAPHRYLPVQQAMAAEPAMRSDGLRGAIRFYDCQEEDARFCVENILHAADLGASCANYCAVTEFVERGDQLVTAKVSDVITGGQFEVTAKCFVNAGGPWVEQIAGLARADDRLRLAPTKGVHVLLPKLTRGEGICFQGRRDGRIMFVLPWHDCSLVGTTDTDYHGKPEDVRAERADVEYLLDEVRGLFPQITVDENDVITTTAGLRPLLKSDENNPSGRSREHQIVWQGNLLSIAGGKYTTYRLMAEQVVDQICARLGKHRECATATTALPDHRVDADGQKIADSPEVFESDVVAAVRGEMATTVADVMDRRTGLGVSRFSGRGVAEHVARVMGMELAWNETEKRAAVDEYLRESKDRIAWKDQA